MGRARFFAFAQNDGGGVVNMTKRRALGMAWAAGRMTARFVRDTLSIFWPNHPAETVMRKNLAFSWPRALGKPNACSVLYISRRMRTCFFGED